ncbi:MAG: FAD-binding oxidoreductase [Candidatus Heimdallarchaeota archaeon]|nr:FAD-binding oxidoreductase [Candidatus Heimdallarchaeota archaeon]
MTETKYDVVIIGAGIFGLATAYHILRNNEDLEVLVVDKAASAGSGNTAQSAGMYRDTFSSEVNLVLSSTTRDFYRYVQTELGVNLSLKDIAYLWLMDRTQFEKNKNAVEIMLDNKVRIEILDKDEIKQKIPDLVTDFDDNENAELLGLRNIDYGILGRDCGELDADKITRDFYENEFKKLGGETLYSTRIKRLVLEPIGEELGVPGEPVGWQEKKVGSIEIQEGKKITAEMFILATGPWANELLLPIGIDSHSLPLKKSLYRVQTPRLASFLDNKNFNEEQTIPFTIFPIHGIYVKPVKYNNSVWIGGGSTIGHPYVISHPDSFETEENPLDDTQADSRIYEYDQYLILSEYLPILKDQPLTSQWAGFYAMNTMDKNPVVFKPNGIKSLIVVTSGSGSGIMKADAVGRIAEALYCGEENAELFGGKEFKVSRLGLKSRDVDKEDFVI